MKTIKHKRNELSQIELKTNDYEVVIRIIVSERLFRKEGKHSSRGINRTVHKSGRKRDSSVNHKSKRQKDRALPIVRSILAMASFSCGLLIMVVCLFLVPPVGEISGSVTGIIIEMLALSGAFLGIQRQ